MIVEREQGAVRGLVLHVRIADWDGAVPLEPVVRVVRAVAVTRLGGSPRSARALLGVIDVHGRVCPVVDLRRLLNLPERDLDVDDRLVLLERDEQLLALPVDSVGGVVRVEPAEAVHALASGRLGGIVAGSVRLCPEAQARRVRLRTGRVLLREGPGIGTTGPPRARPSGAGNPEGGASGSGGIETADARPILAALLSVDRLFELRAVRLPDWRDRGRGQRSADEGAADARSMATLDGGPGNRRAGRGSPVHLSRGI